MFGDLGAIFIPAYTDAGLLQLIIMSVVGFIVAIPVYLAMWKGKIGGWFRERKRRQDKNTDNTP